MKFADIWDDVRHEMERRPAGYVDLEPAARIVRLVEELGEVAAAMQDEDEDGLRLELVQVVALAFAWLEELNDEPPLTPRTGGVA